MLSMLSMITMKSNLPISGIHPLASITIRNLDETVKAKLRVAAARHGCSMEEEVRRILRLALLVEGGKGQIGSRIHQRFTELGGIDLQEPSRSEPRSAPDFAEPG